MSCRVSVLDLHRTTTISEFQHVERVFPMVQFSGKTLSGAEVLVLVYTSEALEVSGKAASLARIIKEFMQRTVLVIRDGKVAILEGPLNGYRDPTVRKVEGLFRGLY